MESACLTIRVKSAPASPDLAGLLEIQMAGSLAERISAKSPSLFTLSGANSRMSSSGDDHSSRCLMRSQPYLPPNPPFVRTRAHDPLSL